MRTSLPAALFMAAVIAAGPATARDVSVSSADGLAGAVKGAAPGDTIVIAPGTYRIRTLRASIAGTSDAPIVVCAAVPGSVVLEAVENRAFRVTAPYWTFENLVVRGACAKVQDCSHAFHLVQHAHRTVIRNNRLVEWDAMIKGNGEKAADGAVVYPDDVLIEGNAFYNSAVRPTGASITFIDVVGGKRWTVRDNFLADFGKGGGNKVSYGAFLKGGHVDGVFERNVVICEWKHRGGTRIGLSFGGGGTDRQYRMCADDACAVESVGGILRNNLIVGCNDAGIYLNQARETGVYNNTLIATRGIHVRFAHATAEVSNNMIAGSIRNRDGGSHTGDGNLTIFGTGHLKDPARGDLGLSDPTMVVDRGVPVPAVADDLCGNPRVGAPDVGAVEYAGQPCDVSSRFPD